MESFQRAAFRGAFFFTHRRRPGRQSVSVCSKDLTPLVEVDFQSAQSILAHARKIDGSLIMMTMRFCTLGLALAAISLGRASTPADAASHGKIIRVKTGTCIVLDVEEILHRDGAPATFAIAGVWVSPAPESKVLVSISSSLVGAAVSGVTVTTKGWTVAVQVSRLAITPKGAARPSTSDELAFILGVEAGTGISAGIRYGKLAPNTLIPVVSAEGLSGGTGTVISGGYGATPLTPYTQDQLDYLFEKQAAAKAKPAETR